MSDVERGIRRSASGNEVDELPRFVPFAACEEEVEIGADAELELCEVVTLVTVVVALENERRSPVRAIDHDESSEVERRDGREALEHPLTSAVEKRHEGVALCCSATDRRDHRERALSNGRICHTGSILAPP